ncbi:MAG: hypothetical protein ACKVZ6_06115 [Kineosporiaceae bacterium]
MAFFDLTGDALHVPGSASAGPATVDASRRCTLGRTAGHHDGSGTSPG